MVNKYSLKYEPQEPQEADSPLNTKLFATQSCMMAYLTTMLFPGYNKLLQNFVKFNLHV